MHYAEEYNSVEYCKIALELARHYSFFSGRKYPVPGRTIVRNAVEVYLEEHLVHSEIPHVFLVEGIRCGIDI